MTTFHTTDELSTAHQFFDASSDAKLLTCKVKIKNSDVELYAWSYKDKIIVGSGRNNWENGVGTWGTKVSKEEVDSFITAEVVGNAYTKTVSYKTWEENNSYNSYGYNTWGRKEVIKTKIDSYDERWDYNSRANIEGKHWLYCKVLIKTSDSSEILELKFKQPQFGKAKFNINPSIIDCSLDFFGLERSWKLSLSNSIAGVYDNESGFYNLYILLNYFELEEDADIYWHRFLRHYDADNVDDKGVKSLYKRKAIKPNLDRLREEEPTKYNFLRWLHNSSGKGGVSNNNLIAAFLKSNGDDYKKLKSSLERAMKLKLESPPSNYNSSYYDLPVNRNVCFLLPNAKERHEEKLAKKQWQFRKGLKNQAEGLGITKEQYPRLLKAVEANDIPIGVFHAPSDKNEKINIEFALWEKALKRKGWLEVLSDIAHNASGRKTYSKKITPYISFLFKIEKYLDKHTPRGKKWKAIPKFVNSEWELEMSDAAEEETAKKRSALTPVADNENRTVVVPYAGLSIYGRQTTYCYSLNYYVYEEGLIDPESETPVVADLEKNLNGRDDYGLMFYTLTGSPSNRGYPAFLIIFERLQSKTRVHFHRVHPSRYRNGQAVPACNLIKECYRYMAGNIKAEDIYAQQGDLIFIPSEGKGLDFENDGKNVLTFESHDFNSKNSKVVRLIENTSKSAKNRLGHIFSDVNFTVDHPEHDPLVDIPAGIYEVRRCKSWEANPRAVWSLTID